MWHNSRMVVLVALSAALYAAILIPFKIIPIIPGFTELRPGNAVPVVCGLLFGPAAAWGCAIGNLIADFFGTVGPGSLFGMVGNFLFAYIPYRLWVMVKGNTAPRGVWADVPLLVVAVFAGSAACGIVIGMGVEALGLVPAASVILTTIITLNNCIIGIVLGLPLLALVAPRARRWNLTFGQILRKDEITGTFVSPIAGVALVLVCLAGVTAALDKGGTLARWASVLGVVHIEPALDAEGKPLPVSFFVPGGVSLFQFSIWCSVAIIVLSVLMAKLGYGRRETPAISRGVAGEGTLAFEGVSFTYPGAGRAALSGVSLTQQAGQARFVMGLTGAGKSTLCLCTNGVVPQMEPGELVGTVLVGGLNTREWSVDELSRVSGLLFQDFETQLFCSDVESEVAFGLENRGVAREAMAERVSYWLRELELEHLAGRDPGTLSGGEKQRLALASVMACEPPIAVLDEPTTDLDPVGRAEVVAAIQRLADAGRTMLVVSTDAEEALTGDALTVLRDGEVVRDGAPAEVLDDAQTAWSLGIRPHPLAQLADAMRLPSVPHDLEQAVASLRQAGARLDEGAFKGALDAEAAPLETPQAVALEGVSAGYGTQQALRDVSLDVREGDFVAVLGPNGAGKTTLCKLMMGLVRPTAGRVLVAGRDVAAMRVSELASSIGYLYQNPDSQIFAATVYEEVAFGPRNLGRDREQVARLVSHALHTVGLTGTEDEDPFALTRGERQRVALAAILACEPRIIIFDEPTTGLDAPQQDAIMQLLAELSERGRTIIMVTHHAELAMAYARRLVLMQPGSIIADGPTRRVVADAETFRAADQTAPVLAEVSQALFGVTLLSCAEYERFVGTDAVQGGQ